MKQKLRFYNVLSIAKHQQQQIHESFLRSSFFISACGFTKKEPPFVGFFLPIKSFNVSVFMQILQKNLACLFYIWPPGSCFCKKKRLID